MSELESGGDIEAGKCAQCGKPLGKGPFCSGCGARVVPGFCPDCGGVATPGDRFCSSCGSSLGAGPPSETAPAGVAAHGGRSQGKGSPNSAGPASAAGKHARSSGVFPGQVPSSRRAPLIIGVFAFVGLIIFLTADIWRAGPDIPAVPDTPFGLGPAPQVDLAAMSPREAADRLFERVVRAAESGDSVEVQTFMPMALGAYELARPLDTDGEFHVTVLQRIADMNIEALAIADSLLATDPTHLLLLSSAAEAARAAGDSVRAAGYYQALLDAYADESAAPRQEYLDHPFLVPEMPARAREFLGIGGFN